jgi:hypothetical protein
MNPMEASNADADFVCCNGLCQNVLDGPNNCGPTAFVEPPAPYQNVIFHRGLATQFKFALNFGLTTQMYECKSEIQKNQVCGRWLAVTACFILDIGWTTDVSSTSIPSSFAEYPLVHTIEGIRHDPPIRKPQPLITTEGSASLWIRRVVQVENTLREMTGPCTFRFDNTMNMELWLPDDLSLPPTQVPLLGIPKRGTHGDVPIVICFP